MKMSAKTANTKLKSIQPIGFNDLLPKVKATKAAKTPKTIKSPKSLAPKSPKKGISIAIAIGKAKGGGK